MSKSLFRKALYIYLLLLQADVLIIAHKLPVQDENRRKCVSTLQRYISYLQEDELRDIHLYYVAYGLVALDRAATALHNALHQTCSWNSILLTEYTWTAHAAVQALIAERRKNIEIQQCWESASNISYIAKYQRGESIDFWEKNIPKIIV